MRQFIKTVVATDSYKEVEQKGGKYVVHLEPVENAENGTTTCWETMTDVEPDMAIISANLATWKAHLDEVELKGAKQRKIAELEAYDDSTAVNGFIIRTADGDFTEWLDPYKRNNASRAIESAKKLGVPTLTTAIGDIPVTLTTEDADTYLAQIEMYAVTCAGVTAQHKAAISALASVQDVERYDFTQGYPAKLVFDV
jgi:hypothetical protein